MVYEKTLERECKWCGVSIKTSEDLISLSRLPTDFGLDMSSAVFCRYCFTFRKGWK